MYLLEFSPDDTESLNALTTIYDILVLCFGLDEDDLHNNTEVSFGKSHSIWHRFNIPRFKYKNAKNQTLIFLGTTSYQRREGKQVSAKQTSFGNCVHASNSFTT